MDGYSPLFASAVIACIGEGRAPTSAETLSVASRIWVEAGCVAEAGEWSALPPDSRERRLAISVAQVALQGA